MSLKKKFKYVYAVSGYVIAVALLISIMLSIRGMVIFTDTLDENDKAMNRIMLLQMRENYYVHIYRMNSHIRLSIWKRQAAIQGICLCSFRWIIRV